MSSETKRITKARFNALCFSRHPIAEIMNQEVEWWSDKDEIVIGTVLFDLQDKDWAVIVLGRDETGIFRAIDIDASIATQKQAGAILGKKILAQTASGQKAFPQGDNRRKRHEILRPQVSEEKLHRNFKIIQEGKHHEAARRMIEEIALAFIDVDGNYAKDFQTTGFNARLWELYLFAFLYEQRFAISREFNRPDFCAIKWGFPIGIEACTVNPTEGEDRPNPKNEKEFKAFREEYMPIKFGSALFSKLQKKYWELPHMKGVPFILAIHDFSANDSMVWSAPALDEYLYGTRATWNKDANGKLHITEHPIAEHIWKDKRIPSGFFKLPGSENIGAILFSNSATVAKFNRIGVLAGFGRPDVRIFRMGARHHFDPDAVEPIPFNVEVLPGAYDENWSEGARLFHNPSALIPIPEDLFAGCAHHYFDGKQRKSYLPDGFIHQSITHVIEITK